MINVVNARTYRSAGVYIGRQCGRYPGSVLQNPFHIGKGGTREEVVEKYRLYASQQYKTNPAFKAEALRLVATYRTDGTLVLICWCAPLACHGDVLKQAILALCK